MSACNHQLAGAQPLGDLDSCRVFDAGFDESALGSRFIDDEDRRFGSISHDRLGRDEHGVGALFGVDVELHRRVDGQRGGLCEDQPESDGLSALAAFRAEAPACAKAPAGKRRKPADRSVTRPATFSRTGWGPPAATRAVAPVTTRDWSFRGTDATISSRRGSTMRRIGAVVDNTMSPGLKKRVATTPSNGARTTARPAPACAAVWVARARSTTRLRVREIPIGRLELAARHQAALDKAAHFVPIDARAFELGLRGGQIRGETRHRLRRGRQVEAREHVSGLHRIPRGLHHIHEPCRLGSEHEELAALRGYDDAGHVQDGTDGGPLRGDRADRDHRFLLLDRLWRLAAARNADDHRQATAEEDPAGAEAAMRVRIPVGLRLGSCDHTRLDHVV